MLKTLSRNIGDIYMSIFIRHNYIPSNRIMLFYFLSGAYIMIIASLVFNAIGSVSAFFLSHTPLFLLKLGFRSFIITISIVCCLLLRITLMLAIIIMSDKMVFKILTSHFILTDFILLVTVLLMLLSFSCIRLNRHKSLLKTPSAPENTSSATATKLIKSLPSLPSAPTLQDLSQEIDIDIEIGILPSAPTLQNLSEVRQESNMYNMTECTICLEPFNNDYCTLKCGHITHEKCLEMWCRFRKCCPVCNVTT